MIAPAATLRTALPAVAFWAVPARHEPAPVTAGRLLGGRYRLGRLIAKGGMAEVWEGHDEVLSRAVAVKVLHSHLAGDGLFLERFRREAVTAAGLAHPGVVSTFDTGVDDGTAYIVMELVKGRTLRQYLHDEGPLPPAAAVSVTRQIGDVLAHAHRAGLIHRDVKPANVLLVEDGWSTGRVKVTDFGIAKAGAGLSELTRTGMVLGTPKYLAPEQIRGDEPDPRSDLYSLGVVLYEMLAGKPPFRGETDMATALAHMNEPVPKLSRQGVYVPHALEAIVEDLLAKDPARRVQTADDLLRRLDALGTRDLSGGARTPTDLRRARPDTPADRTSATAVDGKVAAPTAPKPARRKSVLVRGALGPTLIVGLIAVVAVVVAALALSPGGTGHNAGGSGPTGGGSVRIANVSVWMANSRPPDNPAAAKYTFDGNSSTSWSTDDYPDATFGNLYPGIGLAIQLSASSTVHHLTVTSSSQGWAAQAFVSSGPLASGQSVSAWGSPTDTRSGIPGGVTLQLGGHKASWVLLWITNLGPAHRVVVNEVGVS